MANHQSVSEDEIRRLMTDDDALDVQIINFLVPEHVKRKAEDRVLEEFRQEGKGYNRDPGVANRWGAEFGRRVFRELRGVAGMYASDMIKRLEGQLHAAVCIEFKYCERRYDSALQEKVTLATAVADALLPTVTGTLLPVTTIAVFVVKNNLLDKICKCRASEPAT